VEKPRTIQEIEAHCDIEETEERKIYKLPNTDRVAAVINLESETVITNDKNISLLFFGLDEKNQKYN
jgi:hypothetical protein